ncbi:putative pentatricopeptide repeat-containing protein At1g12700, mitochondrial [Humulus lupulus]|uniref:putative pentatricopeptide repeat-containing protein At1g12700, mitochondrial n=1 Tax=Humulus lupulus TaxID=3486 RepID=UPI002B40BE34|nr:putative pentatricopeptide repeat-containing protein At1g12700, mitochondrial [Humulus lupulus]
MPANVRRILNTVEVQPQTLNTLLVRHSKSFDFLNQFLPFDFPISDSSNSINPNERRKIAVGLSKIVKTQKIYVLQGFSREFCPSSLVNIMKMLETRDTAFAFFKFAFRDHSDRVVRSSGLAALFLSAEDLQFLAQDMVSYIIDKIGAVRSRYLVEFMWEYHYRYESHFSVLNTLMRGFLNAEMGYEALQIVNKMREVGVSPSSSASRILFKLLIRVGDYGSVWKLFRDMVSKGPPISTHTFNMMILGFCRKGLLSTGESLFHVMRKFNCEPDVFGYNIVINANCMMGQISNALEWMHFMISNVCEPSVVTFNTVINALCKEGDMVKARSFFDGILNVGVFPNTVTYNIMIDGYVKSGDIGEADKLYEEMKNKGINPDGMTFNILIAGHNKYGRENIGDMLLRDLAVPEVFPVSSLFDVSIAVLCWAGRLDEAMESVENMLEKGFPLSVVAFNSIIAAYSKGGFEEKAYKAYLIMSRFGLTPSSSTCCYLLLGLCKKGCLNEAKDLLCNMTEKGFPINKLAFLVLLDGYLRTGNLNGAWNLWYEMQSRGIRPDAVSFAIFINGLARAGVVEEAYDMLLKMVVGEFVHTDSAYNFLINWFYNHGRLNRNSMC